MGEFITLEEAAERLGVPESTVRQWIQRGQARASRRDGSYVLRSREVERLGQTELGRSPSPAKTEAVPALRSLSLKPDAPAAPRSEGERLLSPVHLRLNPSSELQGATPTEEPAEPRPKKALPPRPRAPEGDQAGPDRRKRLGRRASDISLEVLAQEVRAAVYESLTPVSEAQAQILKRLDNLARPTPSLSLQIPAPQAAPEADLTHRLEALEQALAARERQLRHSQQEGLQLRQRLLELDGLREVAQRNQDLVAQLAGAQTQVAALSLEHSELLAETRGLKARLADAGGASTALRELQERNQGLEHSLGQARQELTAAQARYQQLSTEMEQRARQDSGQGGEARVAQVERELARERALVARLRQEADEAAAQAEAAVSRLADFDTMKRDLEQTRGAGQRWESERAKLASECNNLHNEVESLRDWGRRAEDLEQQLAQSNQQLEKTQARLTSFEREYDGIGRQFEEREQQMQAEARRLKEQLNDMQFKMQMAGQGQSVANLEDSRRMMDQLVELQNSMEEKDRVVAQSYAERSELRSKLEEVNRAFYELQQRYDKEKEEWSQVVARQIQMSSERERTQASQAAEALPPDKKSTNWGRGLFKLRGDT